MLPALNEESTVGAVARGIPSSIAGVGSFEILVVDDGSRDRTSEVARDAGAHVVRHHRRRGLGAAFHTGLSYALDRAVDILVTIDADGQFDPADIPELIQPILAGEADFTSASRFKDRTLTPRMPWTKRMGNRLVSRFISMLTGQRFHDVSCGMRSYSRRAILHLYPLASFTYTQEVFLNLSFKQLEIVEVPIRVRGERAVGRSRVADNLWRYGYRTAKIILRCYRDYFPLRFFGGAGLLLALPAAGFGSFVLRHYAETGRFSPHKWAGFVALAFGGFAVLMFFVGMIGDMLNRHRLYLEEILYRQRGGDGSN
jgi:glycosyltransferase involved in cell wall biosynthesis